jgi:hypothetical protein
MSSIWNKHGVTIIALIGACLIALELYCLHVVDRKSAECELKGMKSRTVFLSTTVYCYPKN